MSQEQAEVARIFAEEKLAGLHDAMAGYKQAIALQFGPVAVEKTIAVEVDEEESEQARINANFVFDAVGLLPYASGELTESNHYNSNFKLYDAKYTFHIDSHDSPTALFLSRVVQWYDGVPYYPIGQNGRHFLFVPARVRLNQWASLNQSMPINQDIMINNWTDMVALDGSMYKATEISYGSRDMSKKRLLDLAKMVQPASKKEQKIMTAWLSPDTKEFTLGREEGYGNYYVSNTRKKGDPKNLSGKDIEIYDVIGHLTDLTALFGKEKEFIELCSKWKGELPTFLESAKPDSEVLGQLAMTMAARRDQEAEANVSLLKL